MFTCICNICEITHFLPPIKDPSTAPINIALITNSWSRHDKQNTSRSCKMAPDIIPVKKKSAYTYKT